MSEWKEYRLGDVSIGNGSYGIAASAIPKNESKYTYLRITDINDDGSLNYDGLMSVDEEKASNYLLAPNDIVFARTGNSTGRTYFYDGSDGELVYAGFLIKFSINPQIINPKILKYYTHSKIYYDWVASFDSGATRGNINAKTYSEMSFRLPQREIQDKIVSILSSLDEKIETNRKINARLEELAQALFKSWFIDFEPFGGQMPKDWEEDSIYRYVDVIYGAPYKSELFNDKGDGLPLIRIRDLKTNTPQVYTTEILPNTEYIDFGDIVVGMDAEFEPYFWFGSKGLLNQRVCKFKSKNPRVGNSFILYLTRPALRFVQSYKVGTTVSHLGKSDIDKFKFTYPHISIIEEYTNIAEPILQRRIELSVESARLAALRDTLLPKLMSGELKPE